ncbi:hypothetical protein D5R40_15485 [Okeania hirsuta]|uniref:Uncharacterized protein n=1 Tax=Okeania hirsuta TaxID=1458930 RepID=A0A3N6P9E3_9CYAN|nr:hypothetical protein D5R40_15485 [Okeania hirsuta]
MGETPKTALAYLWSKPLNLKWLTPKNGRYIVSVCRVFPRKAPLEEATGSQIVIFGTLRLQSSQVGKNIKSVIFYTNYFNSILLKEANNL